ncbi:MAG: PolC-type DNA polymerase III [Leptonema sp. (in: bacteria)]
MNLKNKIKLFFWQRKFCKNQNNVEICFYLDHLKKQKYHKDFHLNTYLSIDTETTGLTANDFIISFGGIRIVNLEIDISDSWEVYIKNETSGGEQSTAIHGIRTTTLQHGIDTYNFYKNLLYFLSSDIIVGHHITFDKEIMNRDLKKIFSIEILNPFIDTFDLALYYDGYAPEDALNFDENKQKQYSLDNLIQRFSISASGRHTSIGDAWITAELFLKLISKFKNKKDFDIRKFFK